MKLTEYLDSLSYDIAFWLAGIKNPDYPIGQLGDLSMEVSTKLRAAAIIVLVAKGDSDTFFHNLIRSANCRVRYLERLREAGIRDDHHQAAGRVNGLVDAVAASDFGTARQIATLSPREWMNGHEYEDDFCYAQILQGLIAASRDIEGVNSLFARFEGVLAGQTDARLDVTRAIASGDGRAFDEAFEALLEERAGHIQAREGGGQMDDAEVVAERQVYVEGLALLRIAERLGFATQREYRFCPSIARRPMRTPFPGE